MGRKAASYLLCCGDGRWVGAGRLCVACQGLCIGRGRGALRLISPADKVLHGSAALFNEKKDEICCRPCTLAAKSHCRVIHLITNQYEASQLYRLWLRDAGTRTSCMASTYESLADAVFALDRRCD